MFEKTFATTSKSREGEDFSITSNSRPQIKENQFIEFIKLENRYRILKYQAQALKK